MTRNMGSIDRGLRALVGLALLAGAFLLGWFGGWMVWAAAAVGVIMLATAAMGNCPAYSIVGIKTCKT
ncbi:DUF2892 domain-containing protein [Tabrizicola piscis]|jgi:Protein of unknown function (DUF2892)|uniref:DUF2892 domain-containing protein n=1 Tax=Tabrizicola piscis TaxID=2494374 RepID=A0A3S8U8S0_9RHOB|nr:DUF2892 domain-containing protein [Tabrizicola piscis]AZL60056.1 DUF2892 domain-containing protein [Tabrizicola piscis]